MDRRKNGYRWRGMFLAAMLVILAGCGKEKKDSGEAVTGNHMYSIGEKGVAYVTSLERGENKFLFYDMETENVYPLCSRPNCRHIPGVECAAVKDKAFAPLVYGDGLYYYTYKDGLYRLYGSDVSGENERELFALGENYQGFGESVVTGNSFYTVCDWYEFDETESGMLRGRMELLKIDLETGEAETLLQSEMASDGTVWWNLEHVYDNKIYFTARCRGETKGDVLEDGIYSLDLSTEKVQNLVKLDDIRTADWREGTAVYYQQTKRAGDPVTLYQLDLESGESEELVVCHVPESCALLKEKFVWWELDSVRDESSGRWRCLDLETKEAEEFGEATPYADTVFLLDTFEKDGKEMIWGERRTESESGEETSCYVVLSSEDFLKGDESGQIVMEKE